mmetsp:Transcript_13507/g.43257  ORF Transcript_13507/g.43257 Transcript_13507/m.43257 type:complete len:205 (+) Transcript_13507:336-950(+)
MQQCAELLGAFQRPATAGDRLDRDRPLGSDPPAFRRVDSHVRLNQGLSGSHTQDGGARRRRGSEVDEWFECHPVPRRRAQHARAEGGGRGVRLGVRGQLRLEVQSGHGDQHSTVGRRCFRAGVGPMGDRRAVHARAVGGLHTSTVGTLTLCTRTAGAVHTGPIHGLVGRRAEKPGDSSLALPREDNENVPASRGLAAQVLVVCQ